MANSQTHQQFCNMFIESLQGIFSTEDQCIEAMPKYLGAISTYDLRGKLKNHFNETAKQKERLLKIFSELNETSAEIFCEGMKKLLKECDKVISESFPGIVKDAALNGMSIKTSPLLRKEDGLQQALM